MEKKQQKQQKQQKIESKCPILKKCGGCDSIDTPYEQQLEAKRKVASKALAPFCKIEGILGMEEPYHYRNKVHATFSREKGVIIAGTYEKKSHRVVKADECLIQNDKANQIIRTICEMCKGFKIKTYDEDSQYGLLRHVLIRTAALTGEIMVVLVLASPILPSKNNFVKALRQKHPEISTVVVNVNSKKTSMVLGDKEAVIYGKGFIVDELLGKKFRISPKSFYQVNVPQTEKLYGKALEYAALTGKEIVIDAYCGTGTIGILASDDAKEVIGVELNGDAIKDARQNAKQNGVTNISFYQNDASKFLVQMAEQNAKADVVIMDPPRAGSDEEFMSSVIQLQPNKIVYISCNIETLARDLAYFTKYGYEVKKGVAVDMFPHVGEHIESCVLLTKKGSKR